MTADMKGKTFAGFTVLFAAPSWHQKARWHVRHTCGGEMILPGTTLRSAPPKSCPSCRPTSQNLYGHGRVRKAP